jgi:hypothetical protein
MAIQEQRKATIGLTVYEKVTMQKGSVRYRPLSVNGAAFRRVAVTPASTAKSVTTRLLLDVGNDVFYELARRDGESDGAGGLDEYCAEDVALIAIGFVEGKVWYCGCPILTSDFKPDGSQPVEHRAQPLRRLGRNNR